MLEVLEGKLKKATQQEQQLLDRAGSEARKRKELIDELYNRELQK